MCLNNWITYCNLGIAAYAAQLSADVLRNKFNRARLTWLKQNSSRKWQHATNAVSQFTRVRFKMGASQGRSEWIKICDLKSPCNALPQMWYESLFGCELNHLYLAPQGSGRSRTYTSVSSTRWRNRWEDFVETRPNESVRFFFYFIFFLRSCVITWPTSPSPTSSKPGVCFGPDTLDPQPQHSTAGLINDLSYLWNTFTGAGK